VGAAGTIVAKTTGSAVGKRFSPATGKQLRANQTTLFGLGKERGTQLQGEIRRGRDHFSRKKGGRVANSGDEKAKEGAREGGGYQLMEGWSIKGMYLAGKGIQKETCEKNSSPHGQGWERRGQEKVLNRQKGRRVIQ